MILTEERSFERSRSTASIFKAESRQMVCFYYLCKEEFYMIRLYVARVKLVKEGKEHLYVRLVLPVERK